MQVFKAFMKMAKKRLSSNSLYFIIFAIICVIMTLNADKNVTSNFESSSLDVCIIDEDHSNASAALTEYLGSIHNLIDLPNDEETLQDNLYYRYVDYILTIPYGFEDALLSGETNDLLTNVKVPGSANGTFIDQQISSYLQTLELYLAGGYTLSDAISTTNHSISDAPSVKSESFCDNQSVSSNQYIFYFFRYLAYVLLSLIVSGLAPLIVTMNKREIKERTLCSSLSVSGRTGQIALGSILYSVMAWMLFMILGIICYSKSFFTINVLYCILNSFVYLLTCVSLTLFASSFSPNTNVVNMISNIVGLGTSFLCGVFVPQSMLADNIVKASRFLPGYWYTRINDMMGGLSDTAIDMNTYWLSIGIQCLFTIALFIAAMVSAQAQRQRRNS